MDEQRNLKFFSPFKKRQKLGIVKIAALDAAFAPLFAGTWKESSCFDAYRLVHSLTGSSGTYGYPEISGLARSVEALIKESLDSRRSPDDVMGHRCCRWRRMAGRSQGDSLEG